MTIARKTAPKRVNASRRNREWKRAYHSDERVAFVKNLPCCACGSRVGSDNAHVTTGGMGRKADYTLIVPLCRDYIDSPGCHGYLHRVGRDELEGAYGVDLDAIAEKVESSWLSHEEERS